MDVDNFKEFLQTPELLLGIPLILLGLLGVMAILSPLGISFPRYGAAAEMGVEAGPHPTPQQYVIVGVILAVVTVVEVAVYYLDALEGALLGILMVLSATKFLLVATWFMHLQFDSRLFSTLFAGGLALVVALFMVVLATLGASLV